MSDVASPEARSDFMRQRQLRRTEILNSGVDEDFNRMARLAAQITESAASAIAYFDGDSVWLKAVYGDVIEKELSVHLCRLVLAEQTLVIIENCTTDARLNSSESSRQGSFAAMPIFSEDKLIIGALCLFDSQRRQLTVERIQSLECLAQEVTQMTAAFRRTPRPHQISSRIAALQQSAQAVIVVRRNGDIDFLNQTASQLFQLQPQSAGTRDIFNFIKHVESAYGLPADALSDELLGSLRVGAESVKKTIHLNARKDLICETVQLDAHESVAFYFQVADVNGFIEMGQLASSLIHDINGSMTVIVGAARQLVRGELTVADRSEIDQRVLRVSSFVSHLIVSVRELYTDPSPKMVNVDLAESVKQAVRLRSEALQREKIELDMQLVSSIVAGRPIQLMQIFANLIKDSVIAMRGLEHKNIRIEMITDETFIRVRYADTRAPLTDEKKKNLFEFFRLPNPDSSDATVGLALVEKMISKHRGKVLLTDSKNGFEIDIHLPLKSI